MRCFFFRPIRHLLVVGAASRPQWPAALAAAQAAPALCSRGGQPGRGLLLRATIIDLVPYLVYC